MPEDYLVIVTDETEDFPEAIGGKTTEPFRANLLLTPNRNPVNDQSRRVTS